MLLQFFAALADAEAARDRERPHAGCDKKIAFTALALDYFRRPLAKFVVEPRLPEIGGLHHVGVGGNHTHVHWKSLLISEGCQSVQVFLMRCIAPPTIEGKADHISDRGILKNDPRHPCRVGLHHRTLGVDVESVILWFWIGDQAEYVKLCTNQQGQIVASLLSVHAADA